MPVSKKEALAKRAKKKTEVKPMMDKKQMVMMMRSMKS